MSIELFTNGVLVTALVLWALYLGKEGYAELSRRDTLWGKVWTWTILVIVTAAYSAALVCTYNLISGRY